MEFNVVLCGFRGKGTLHKHATNTIMFLNVYNYKQNTSVSMIMENQGELSGNCNILAGKVMAISVS